jgi:hypothetical protein
VPLRAGAREARRWPSPPRRAGAGGLLALLLVGGSVAAASPAEEKHFEEKVRPVLVQHCYGCHSAQARKSRGGLRVDSRDALLRGGDSGPAVVPGRPQDSLLLQALRHQGPLAMPPKEKLPAEVVADFERWVRAGAPGPRGGAAGAARPAPGAAAGRNFWAFQPPRRHALPPVRDPSWPRGRLDHFLLAALEQRGLRPAPDADRLTLLRRVSFDLTGLPPTPQEQDAFLADDHPGAFARVVDRLLASPAFGERWGRHWLDVARYADSTGKGDNLTYHDAWRYRDYVLAACNADKPFDTFVREQVAGDLLAAPTQALRDERLTATGFLVVGPKALADRDVLRRKMDVVDDQVDTVGRAFLGLTLGCARCHDHKFDPVPTADYYALAGILASTRTLDGIKLNNPAVSGWGLRPLGADGERLLAARAGYEKELQQVCVALKEVGANDHTAEGARKVRELTAAEQRLRAAAPPAPPLALAVRDEDAPGDLRVHVRGDPHALGAPVPRGFLSALSARPAPPIPPGRSGRLELADWLARPDNPLTARVFVNRAWMHLFGEGLVRTVDNFGAQGEPPTHPELLDELGVEFMEQGWSVKRLVRTVVLSRAYRMSSAGEDRAAGVDPENRLLWRANRRRLEAEALRDAVLAVAGRLDRTMGGSSVTGLGDQAVSNQNVAADLPTERLARRGVYLPVIRNALPTLFEVFDFADPDVSTGKRDATTVATQALYLMNSPFAREQAGAAADRLLALPEVDRLTALYRHAYGRAPTAAEAGRARAFLSELRRELGDGALPSPRAEREAWQALCQAVFASTEFRFVE